MRITKIEFNKFWDEVFGDDWYIGEGECPEEEDEDDDLFDLSQILICWHGEGSPQANGPVRPKDLDGSYLLETTDRIYKRWVRAATHATIVARFEVPKEEVESLKKKLLGLGGIFKSEG